MKAVARLLSFMFHPLLMPTYLFLVLSRTFPAALEPLPRSSHPLFLSLIFIVTFMLPVLLLGIMKVFGSLRSFHMETRGERIVPFTLITLIYFFITYLFYYRSGIGTEENFLRIMIVIDLLAIAATVFTVFFKISVHSLTAWGVVGIMILLNKMSELNTLFYPALAGVMLTGFIMSSRIYLQAHNLKEVMWGGIVGLGTAIAGMTVLFAT